MSKSILELVRETAKKFHKIGAIADADIDVDSLKNIDELKYNANPTIADTDNDGVNDGAEVAIGRNPTVNEPVLLTIVTSLILSN